MGNKATKTCGCGAYKFPHRQGSGACGAMHQSIAEEREANEHYYTSRGLHTEYSRRMHDYGLKESDFL